MNLYLDASWIVALFISDAFTARAEGALRETAPTIWISDFAAAEFASAIARRVRMKDLTARQARQAFSNFDAWTARAGQRLHTERADVQAAEAYLRRLDVVLRTPDALNIAIAQRAGAVLATFDEKMAVAARALGTTVLI